MRYMREIVSVETWKVVVAVAAMLLYGYMCAIAIKGLVN
jgi:hypothetical protein